MFGALPLLLGLGAALYLKLTHSVWLTDAGPFWPYVLAASSAGILVRIAYGPYQDRTGAVTAWLFLLAAWFYVPMWLGSSVIPTSSAVVGGNGHVTVLRDTLRTTEPEVRLLSRNSATRIVHNAGGKFVLNGLELTYGYAASFIATRANGDDLGAHLMAAAAPITDAAAKSNRTWKIAFLADKSEQTALMARICRAAHGDMPSCPLKLTMVPAQDATALGGTWSAQYSEFEALDERHLPSLVHLLTQSEISLAKRDRVFALVLDLATSGAPFAQLVQRSQLLTDDQFDQAVARIVALLSCADCGDAAALAASVNRLNEGQRRMLRVKAVDEAKLSTLLAVAAALRLTDEEIARFSTRIGKSFGEDPSLAVRALDVFGDRLPLAAQRQAVDSLLDAKASYALSALERVNFSADLRQLLIKKVVADATLDDFSIARTNRTKLLGMLTPQELRALIEVSVKRGESSDRWHAFVVESLPVSGMTSEERHRIVNGLVFNSPKAALEFVSKNRDFLDAGEVAEVTRDYSRTVTRDFCLHLSHRNKNWKQNFFSEAQLQIFRDCAEGK